MPSKKLEQYLAADRKIKKATQEKEAVRKHVEKLLRRCRKMGVEIEAVTYREKERFSFNDEELYKWVSSQVDSDTLEELTKKIIDLDKLQEAYLDKKIDTTKMPDSCYSVVRYPEIRVNSKRKKKK